MILSFHQPNYLPNLGFFYKMAHSEKFVVFTNLQFSKQDGWVRRHKIKGVNNDVWLSVPVRTETTSHPLIKDVKIDYVHKWAHKHVANIQQVYGRTEEREALETICSVYETKYERLVDLNLALIHTIKDILEIDTELIFDEEVTGQKQELLINTCKKHGANIYLSGMGGKEYMTEQYYKDLADSGIENRFVEEDLTAQYPYTSLHYIFTLGIPEVQRLIGVRKQEKEPELASVAA